MIRALIFDFDGLILETEEPIYRSWQELYKAHGCNLAYETWAKIIGTADYAFEPLAELERQAGRELDREQLANRQRQREMDLILQQPVMPGVVEYLRTAKQLGLKIGLASSSTCQWVTDHLARLGLLSYFDSIYGSDDVDQTKPDPELYLCVLDDLSVEPQEAIVFEDSPNGVLAARQAGIFCVAIPNAMTRDLPLDKADMRLESLAEISLQELIRIVERKENEGAVQ